TVRYLRNYNKQRPYLIGMAMDLLKDPNCPRWYHYLGREFTYIKNHPKSAIRLLEKQATMKHAWQPEKSCSLVLAGDSWLELGQPMKAAFRYFQASFVDPKRREPWLKLAHLYQTMEKKLPEHMVSEKQDLFLAGATVAKASLIIPFHLALAEDEQNYTYLPHNYLSWGLAWSGRTAEAKYHWLMSCHYDKERFEGEGIYYENVSAVANT